MIVLFTLPSPSSFEHVNVIRVCGTLVQYLLANQAALCGVKYVEILIITFCVLEVLPFLLA